MRARSRGCALCHKGAKMVLFVTGACGRGCWYCPIAAERNGKDAVFANDRPVSAPEDILAEARLMSAEGTSITGGEPFLVPDRVAAYCRLLKEEFGQDHHVHLYTGVAATEAQIRPLAGLVDEIRFHPPEEHWPRITESPYLASARTAKALGFAAGFEVPALPGLEHLLPALPVLDFLNVNELEWGDLSAEEMRRRGLAPSDGWHNAVGGSERWARRVRGHPKVYWCTSASKDAVQLRERLKRIARNTARSFDDVTEDGTVVYGVLEPEPGIEPADLPLPAGRYARCDGRIELSWRELRKRGGKLPGKKYIVERYPNHGVVVEVTPL